MRNSQKHEEKHYKFTEWNANSITNNKRMNIGKVKVDSCRLSIPLIDCRILDTNLIDRIEVQTANTETGALIKSEYRNGTPTVIKNEDGTYLKFWKENQFFYNADGQKIPTLYITFLVNSKHLTNRYFDGITLDTLPLIYNYIRSFNIVDFSLSALENARYNDTDICFDFKSSLAEFNSIKTNLKRISTKPELWHTATNANNSGTWTPTKNNPRDNAKPTTPYFKLYNKEEDFTYNSIEFAKEYFELSDYKDLRRIEVTVSNSQHKRHLSISNVKTFKDFLSLDLQIILQQITSEYFKEKKQMIVDETKLTPTDLLIIDLMNYGINKGATKTELFDFFNRSDISRQARQILVAKFHRFTNIDQFNREQLELNSATKDVFSYLGIDVKK
jgi:hypothetical protein